MAVRTIASVAERIPLVFGAVIPESCIVLFVVGGGGTHGLVGLFTFALAITFAAALLASHPAAVMS